MSTRGVYSIIPGESQGPGDGAPDKDVLGVCAPWVRFPPRRGDIAAVRMAAGKDRHFCPTGRKEFTMKYLPIFPELMEELEEFSDESVGKLMRAMSAYAFAGEEPDFAKGSPERLAWGFCRRKVDQWREKSEARATAGASGGSRPKQDEADESKPKQTEANESKPKQTEANGSKGKPQSQSQSQTEPESEDEDTHTDIPQQGNAGARARRSRSGWYDAENPDAPCDLSWQTSETARRSIAQRIIEKVCRGGFSMAPVITEAGALGQELFRSLEAAMMAGIPPGECQRIGERDKKAWLWEGHLKQLALDAGTAPESQAETWRRQISDCEDDLTAPLVAYG